MPNKFVQSRDRMRLAAVSAKLEQSPGHLAGKFKIFMPVLLLALFVAQAPAQAKKEGFKFENIADSTQGLAGFSRFPALNNGGAVAFVATGSDRKQGVFKSEAGTLVTIASQSGALDTFSDDVVINSAGWSATDRMLAATTEQFLKVTEHRPK